MRGAQVVEFVDPLAESRKRPREDDPRGGGRDEKRGRAGAGGGGGRREPAEAATREAPGATTRVDPREMRELLSQAAREVHDMGTAALSAREQKIWEAKKWAEAGVKLEHKVKMPLKMFLGVQRKQREKERLRRDRARESGVVLGKTKPRYAFGEKRDREGQRRHKSRSERALGGASSLEDGSFRGGVLYLKNAPK